MNTDSEKEKNAAPDTPAPYTPEAHEKKAAEGASTGSKGMHFSWNVRNTAPVKTPPVKQLPAVPKAKQAEEEQALSNETKPEDSPEKEEIKKEEPAPVPPISEDEKKEEAIPAAEQKPVEEKQEKKAKWGSILLDSVLFLAVFGVIGAGAWYIHGEMKKYDIPSPMELAIEEQEELCKHREALQERAFHADEQIHMRQKLESLIRQTEDLNRQIEEKKASIAREHSRVMALQHEIRTEDRALRNVAKGLLPGMRLGNAMTTAGKTYPEAVIYRIQGNKITLRTRNGQSTFPIPLLIKDNLPDLARYAFGIDDMVDMSDFETASGKKKEQKKRKGKLISPKTAKKATAPDYDPAGGFPTVDTESHRNTTNTAGDMIPGNPQQDAWQPPTGDLPL